MKIAVGADHAGFEWKNCIAEHLTAAGHEVLNLGTDSPASVDYPDYALAVAKKVVSGEAALGVLVCGTGIGVQLAANKVHGVRAAVGNTEFEARLAREHNNANILCIGARVVDQQTALRNVDVWLTTEFAGGRHQERIDKIAAIERQLSGCKA